jgi:hypothetical protein
MLQTTFGETLSKVLSSFRVHRLGRTLEVSLRFISFEKVESLFIHFSQTLFKYSLNRV